MQSGRFSKRARLWRRKSCGPWRIFSQVLWHWTCLWPRDKASRDRRRQEIFCIHQTLRSEKRKLALHFYCLNGFWLESKFTRDWKLLAKRNPQFAKSSCFWVCSYWALAWWENFHLLRNHRPRKKRLVKY